MNPSLPKFTPLLAAALLSALAARSRAETAAPPASVTVISPVFDQLLRFSMPARFAAAYENTKDNFYIREAVPKGETVQGWTEMITVTGSKEMAKAANFTPQKLAASVVLGFKKACPETFAVKDFGERKFGEQDAYMAVASCGKVNSSADGHSEAALIVALQGATDAYTIQWAEHRPRAAPGAAIDEPLWRERLRELMPIRACAIVPGEAAPYPSCLKQK